ncbi:MAG: pyruvate kinase [Calditrichaeota bacterium]|nr:MAG: pyruvate kinase [Calditrichota bacterium]
MNYLTRKAKIISTLGPATNTKEQVVKLMKAGMNIARLNFSHGSYKTHLQNIKNVRDAEEEVGRPVAIIQDLQGPKIRIGRVRDGQVEIKNGDKLVITIQELLGDEFRVSTSYQNLPNDVEKGDRILIDDGVLELKVSKKTAKEVHCIVINGGILKANKGINLPGINVSAPTLTEKDKADLLFGLQNGVDYIALSFVRDPKDINVVKDIITKAGKKTPVIAKIERLEAIQQIDEIIQVTDVILIARGDLGVELPTEDVPIIQKDIIRKCNAQGVPVITATQMLESMITTPRPTRAEASDVANAIFDGTDCVMLSGETASGKFPIEAVKMMDKIIRTTEFEIYKQGKENKNAAELGTDYSITDAITFSASQTATNLKAGAIIPLTNSGRNAKKMATQRPHCQILSLTQDKVIQRQLTLYWGVKSFLLETLDENFSFEKIEKLVTNSIFVSDGDVVILTASIPFKQQGETNIMKVFKIVK